MCYMSKSVAAMILLTLFLGTSWAQDLKIDSYEIGLRAGLSNYQGDLVKEDLNIGETNLSVGGFARAYLFDFFSVEGALNYIKITGNDRNYTEQEDPSRYNRALNMENQLLEASLRVLYFPLMDRSPLYSSWHAFQPYVGTGLSFVLSDPEIEDQNINDGIIIGEQESPIISMPIIAGLKYFVSSDISVSVQTCFNVAFSDNLDGYAYLENNDWFMFHAISLAKHFNSSNTYYSKKKGGGKDNYYRNRRRNY